MKRKSRFQVGDRVNISHFSEWWGVVTKVDGAVVYVKWQLSTAPGSLPYIDEHLKFAENPLQRMKRAYGEK